MTENTMRGSNSLFRYLREVRGEMRKVTWPTPEESRRLTIIVLIVTIIFAAFLFFFDFIFSNVMQTIIRQLAGIG